MPSSATVNSVTTAARSSPGTSDVRSVDSRSGSIGKTLAGVYTDVVFVLRVPVDRRAEWNQAIDVGDGHADAHGVAVGGARRR